MDGTKNFVRGVPVWATLISLVVDEEVVRSSETAPAELDAEVDSILDEIDSVLEENAEDFVKSFVQKGGQ
ncbi:MAG: ubiquitin-like protein Pup [Actinomycetota bacterium]|nr:ubiquitin-like protein Pup [Actinomycetota bacterium]